MAAAILFRKNGNLAGDAVLVDSWSVSPKSEQYAIDSAKRHAKNFPGVEFVVFVTKCSFRQDPNPEPIENKDPYS